MTRSYYILFCLTCFSGCFWPDLFISSYNIFFLALSIFLFLIKRKKIAFILLGIFWFNFNASSLFFWNHSDGNSKNFLCKAQATEIFNYDGKSVVYFRVLDHFPEVNLQLDWRLKQPISVGQVWDISYIPRAKRYTLNEGLRYSQKTKYAKHIASKGRVVKATLVLDSFSYRNNIVSRLQSALADYSTKGIMLALMSGSKNLLTSVERDVLQKTGVGHLLAISGLHLSVIMLFVFRLLFGVSKRLMPSDSLINYRASLIISWLCCLLFAWVSGFVVATTRAFIMLSIHVLAQLTMGRVALKDSLLLALFIVLCMDPLAVLSVGFWLSFLALAVIAFLLSSAWVRQSSSIMMFLKIQAGLTVVMSVLQIIFFDGFALHAVWLNFILIPLFSVLVIPLSFGCLLGVLLEIPFYDGLLAALDFILIGVFKLLTEVASLEFAWIPVLGLQLFVVLCGLIFIGLCVFNKNHWLTSVPLVAIGCALLTSFTGRGLWSVHFLDVAQGLAVVIIQNDRAILYDTGARYGDFSYADSVILPFLQAKSVRHLDYIILSHDDNDHAGGLQLLQTKFPESILIANHSNKNNLINDSRRFGCNRDVLAWGEVNIKFLWPLVDQSSNYHSCVVRVEGVAGSLLLTGDLTAAAELELMQKVDELAVDVLQVAHHGSAHSSTLDFVQQVQPDSAVVSVGINNPYHLPSVAVLERLAKLQIQVFLTSHYGQISYHFYNDGYVVRRFSHEINNFWFNKSNN